MACIIVVVVVVDKDMWQGYSSHKWTVKATFSPEPLLFAHTIFGHVKESFSLALLNEHLCLNDKPDYVICEQQRRRTALIEWYLYLLNPEFQHSSGERGGSVVECRTPEREVRGSRPTAAVLCPWARHFTPRKYWLITQEAMAPSRHDWKIVDWDVKPQHNQPNQHSSWSP